MALKTFKKSERLHKKKQIKELFDRGSSFYLYPFKVIHLISSEESDHPQILISVSKRNFKKAVDRNLLKRRIREAYRLNKDQINAGQNLLIAYIYTAKEILTFTEIQRKLIASIERLNKSYQEK